MPRNATLGAAGSRLLFLPFLMLAVTVYGVPAATLFLTARRTLRLRFDACSDMHCRSTSAASDTRRLLSVGRHVLFVCCGVPLWVVILTDLQSAIAFKILSFFLLSVLCIFYLVFHWECLRTHMVCFLFLPLDRVVICDNRVIYVVDILLLNL